MSSPTNHPPDRPAVPMNGSAPVVALQPDERVPEMGPIGPELAARLADLAWADTEFDAGRLDAFRGQFVAVVGRAVLGHGPDPGELRARVSRQHGTPPGRVVVSYVDDWE